MTSAWLHPALPFLAAAPAMLLLPQRARALALVAPLFGVACVEMVAGSGAVTVSGWAIEPVRVDALGLLFARVFAVMGVIGAIYGLHEPRRQTMAAAMVYVAGALTVALAGDLLTLFVGWEVKAVASCAIVFLGGRPGSLRAAWRYLLVHTLGGGMLAIGLALRGPEHGLAFGAMALDAQTAWILAAFALSAAIPPLHGWLTESYPEGSPAGSVFLCAFTTKAAVYALLRGFPGVEMLTWVGCVMALYGVIYAILENDIRRILAYHIVSQVGFMVAGVGMGTDLALNGAAAHAFCHILYKGLLFMSTGAVVYATGRSKLSDLGGLARVMPWTFGLYMVGAFSISGLPLLNGFISKAMVISAAEYAQRPVVELLLTLASVGTFLSVGLKLPWFAFGGERRDLEPVRALPWGMPVGMALAALLCVVTGVLPQAFYRLLPHEVPYAPYTAAHVLGSLELMVGTAIVFFLLRRWIKGPPSVSRDVFALYDLAGRAGLGLSERVVVPAFALAGGAAEGAVRGVVRAAERAPIRRAPVGLWIGLCVCALAFLVIHLHRSS